MAAYSRRSAAGYSRALILDAIAIVAAALVVAALYLRTPPVPQVAFTSLSGETITTAGLKGKVVLVSFWATDCPICVKEMPDMVRTYDRYHASGLELVAVAMQYDPPNYVIGYAERNRLPFKVALDPLGEHARAFDGVRVTPTTFVIDRRGEMVMKITGEVDFAKLHRLLEEKLKEPA